MSTLLAQKVAAPNQYWEPFALLARAACAAKSTDCEALRAQAKEARSLSLAAGTRARLTTALEP